MALRQYRDSRRAFDRYWELYILPGGESILALQLKDHPEQGPCWLEVVLGRLHVE